MAMNGPSGDETEADGGAGGIFADINITPLTDIFLVLLIIFMVTTTAIAEAGGQNGGLRVNLPRGGKSDLPAPTHDLAVAILVDGRIVVGGKVVDEGALARILDQARGENPETLVLVQADQGVAHGRVVSVMELARKHGLSRLAIATRDIDQ
jgi:biopolymer transport protein ExbD